MSFFRVMSSNIVSCLFIIFLIYSFVFLPSLEIRADHLITPISVALITKGLFQHKDIYKFTWTHKSRNLKPITDYVNVIVIQDSQAKTTNVRVRRASCRCTDHYLVKAAIYVLPRPLMDDIFIN